MTRFSITKADRIRLRSEFTQLAQLGRKKQNRHFIAYVAGGKADHCRLGITVTKKVGHAPARNRIKRLIREYFRLNRHKLVNYWDINVIAKREANVASNRTLFVSLDNLFEHIATLHKA